MFNNYKVPAIARDSISIKFFQILLSWGNYAIYHDSNHLITEFYLNRFTCSHTKRLQTNILINFSIYNNKHWDIFNVNHKVKFTIRCNLTASKSIKLPLSKNASQQKSNVIGSGFDQSAILAIARQDGGSLRYYLAFGIQNRQLSILFTSIGDVAVIFYVFLRYIDLGTRTYLMGIYGSYGLCL